MEARPEDVAAPVEQSIVDAGVYVDGRRVDSPRDRRRAPRELRDRPGAMAWIGLFRPTDAQFRPVAEEFGLHELAVEDAIVAHQRPEARALRRHAVRRPARGDLPRRGGGGRVRRDPRLRRAELRPHGAPQPDARPRRRPAPHGERAPSCSPWGPRRSSTRSSTASSTATRRSSPGSRRTSTRSRSRSSAATRRSPAASTSCRARSSSSSARPDRCTACSSALVAGFEKYGTNEELQRYLRDVADHATTVTERVAGFRQSLSDILDGQRDAREPGPERGGQAAHRGELRAERGGQADLRVGRDHLRADAHRHDLRHELRLMPELHWALGYPVRAGADGRSASACG